MKNIFRIAIGTGVVLLIPLALTLLGSGVDGEGFHWTPVDFLVMGALIFITGCIYELGIKQVRNSTKRILLAIVLVVAFFLVWVDLAVGIFNIPGVSGS